MSRPASLPCLRGRAGIERSTDYPTRSYCRGPLSFPRTGRTFLAWPTPAIRTGPRARIWRYTEGTSKGCLSRSVRLVPPGLYQLRGPGRRDRVPEFRQKAAVLRTDAPGGWRRPIGWMAGDLRSTATPRAEKPRSLPGGNDLQVLTLT